MKSQYLIPFILGLQLMHGCALINTQAKPASNTSTPSTTNVAASSKASDEQLDYIAQFSDWPADAQKKELAQILQALSQNKSDIGLRSKAAIIYAIPASKLKDSAKAQSLLDDLLKEKTLDGKQKTLLSLLRDYVGENAKSTSRIKDEQKRADNTQQKLESAQQRADSLQQKLDELKDIEKNMIDRK